MIYRDNDLNKNKASITLNKSCLPANPAVTTSLELFKEARPAARAKGTVSPSDNLRRIKVEIKFGFS